MTKKSITVQNIQISIATFGEEDLICLTDMANAKEGESRAADIIKNWLRNRYTIEFLGTCEEINNPNFKVVESDHFKMHASEADVLNVALFGKTARQWRDENPELESNIRDHATIEQLLVLANIESINAEFIRMNLPQHERLIQLNQIAVAQLQSLLNNPNAKPLK